MKFCKKILWHQHLAGGHSTRKSMVSWLRPLIEVLGRPCGWLWLFGVNKLIFRRIHSFSQYWARSQTEKSKSQYPIIYLNINLYSGQCHLLVQSEGWRLQRLDFTSRVTSVLQYSLDNHSLPSACPTVLGTKWVSNKWIREGAQIWSRPCRRWRELPIFYLFM